MQVAKSCSAKLQCVVSTARTLKSSFERNPQCHNRVSSVHRRSSKYQRKNPLSSGCLKFPYSILESSARPCSLVSFSKCQASVSFHHQLEHDYALKQAFLLMRYESRPPKDSSHP